MSQIRIPFGLNGKTSNSTCGPAAFWKKLKVKASKLWNVAFIEIDGKSYGPILKPSQEHIVAMKIGQDYQTHVYINGQSVFTDNYYIFGELVVSVVNSSVTMNDIVEFVDESFYDH